MKILFLVFILVSSGSFAQNATQEASVLRAMEEGARPAAEALGVPQLAAELAAVSKALLPWLQQQAAGDLSRMTTLLTEFLGNPESFVNRVPAEQRAAIEKIAKRIQSERNRGFHAP